MVVVTHEMSIAKRGNSGPEEEGRRPGRAGDGLNPAEVYQNLWTKANWLRPFESKFTEGEVKRMERLTKRRLQLDTVEASACTAYMFIWGMFLYVAHC